MRQAPVGIQANRFRRWLAARGVELGRGHARLAGERAVEVDGQLPQAREAVIVAVGSGALIPPIPGLADVAAWSNREITTAREVHAPAARARRGDGAGLEFSRIAGHDRGGNGFSAGT